MLKGMIVGLSLGMVAGAVLARKCKSCAQAVDSALKPIEEMKKSEMSKCMTENCCN